MLTNDDSNVHPTGGKVMALGIGQSEIALTREKEFNHSLLESMADGVVACDADGILTLFNRSAREWHGLDPLRLPPDEWTQHYDLFRADGITPLPTDEIPLARAFRGELVRDAGMAIKSKGQPIRFILANGSVIQDEAGRKLGAVVIMRDVTEFRRLELELRKANEELEQRVEERTEELRLINMQLQNELAERAMVEKTLMLTQFSVDHAADGIMWIKPDGRYCYTNEAASRLLGYSAGEFLEMKTSDVNPAHSMEEWLLHWEELKSKKTLFFEATLLRKDGSQVPVEIHANHVVFGDNEYNCASVRDITGRRRMEDALFFVAQRGWLAGTENFFDALAQYLGENLAMDYVVIDRLDENQDIAETVALYAKGAIVPNMRYVLKGTPCENVMGQRLCVYPRDVRQLFPEDGLLAEMRVESYIGIPLWDASGGSIGLIALMDSKPLADVAAATQLLQLVAVRAAAELARERSDRILRTREHEFRTLANSLPDNIVRYDREGRTVYVNPVLEKTLGAAAAEMIGKRVREIHSDGSYETYAQSLDATLTSGENCEIELTLPVSGEEPIVHHIRMIAERDDHGKMTGVLAIGHDITERKRAENALHLQTVELEKEVAERQKAQENLQKKAAQLEEEIEKSQKLNDELEQRVMLAELSADIGCDLTAPGNLRNMLEQCSESLVRHLNVVFARIWTLNDAENVLELQASAGMYTSIDGSHSRVPVGKFKIGLIAEERKPHITNAVLGDPRVHDQEWAERERMVAFAGHPLVIGDKLVGVMAMFSRNQLSDVTLKALESVSNEIAIGIERKRNEEALEQLNEELEQRVKQRTTELDEKNRTLERFNKMFVNRELKMVELKARIRELEGKTV